MEKIGWRKYEPVKQYKAIQIKPCRLGPSTVALQLNSHSEILIQKTRVASEVAIRVFWNHFEGQTEPQTESTEILGRSPQGSDQGCFMFPRQSSLFVCIAHRAIAINLG